MSESTKAFGSYEALTFLQPLTRCGQFLVGKADGSSISNAGRGRGRGGGRLETGHQEGQVLGKKWIPTLCQK